MIGEHDVLVTQVASGPRHDLDGVDAIGPVRVGVGVATDVAVGDQVDRAALVPALHVLRVGQVLAQFQQRRRRIAVRAAGAEGGKAGEQALLYIDRHLLHEGAAAAFVRLARRGIRLRRPDLSFATADHYVLTAPGAPGGDDEVRAWPILEGTRAQDAAGTKLPSSGAIFISLRDQMQMPGAIVALRDSNGDGRFDVQEKFGNRGGTGIVLRNGYLYHAQQTAVVRYPLKEGELKPSGPAEVIATLPEQRGHTEKGLAFDGRGGMYVNVGAPSNACQEKDRTEGSPGRRLNSVSYADLRDWQTVSRTFSGMAGFSSASVNVGDEELVQTAMARGAYAHAHDSIVEHLHPIVGNRPGNLDYDEIYRLGRSQTRVGRQIFRQRQHLWQN